MADINTLDRAVPLEAYREQRSHVFPSANSMNWFVRQNLAELAECGAVIIPAGRKLAVVDKFDQAVQAIGERRARASAE